MKVLLFLFNMAMSLFVAPTPGLILVLYANGGATIPLAQGLAVMVVSAVAYWAWVLERRTKSAPRQTEILRHDVLGSSVGAGIPRAALPNSASPLAIGHADLSSAEERRRAREAVQSHADLPDTLASSKRQPSAAMSDRVVDQRQIKILVAHHEARLMNAFLRIVAGNRNGTLDYRDWAYEADRFLMSVNFAARALNRHEVIAALTAEVEHLVKQNRAASGAVADDFRAPSSMSLPPPKPELQTTEPWVRDTDRTVAAAEPQVDIARKAIERRQREALAARARARALPDRCAEALSKAGWLTQATTSPGFDEIDVFAERGETIIGLRCRPTGAPADEKVLSTVVGAREHFGLDAVGVICTAGFTSQARAFAAVNGVCLLEESDLPDLHVYIAERGKVVSLFSERVAQA